MSLVKTGNKRSTMTNNVSKEILWKGFFDWFALKINTELVNILNYLMFFVIKAKYNMKTISLIYQIETNSGNYLHSIKLCMLQYNILNWRFFRITDRPFKPSIKINKGKLVSNFFQLFNIELIWLFWLLGLLRYLLFERKIGKRFNWIPLWCFYTPMVSWNFFWPILHYLHRYHFEHLLQWIYSIPSAHKIHVT